jgi:hypothetical protein
MNLLVWGIAFFLLGFAGFIVLPFVAGVLPVTVRQRVGDLYATLTQLLADKTTIVASEQGGIDLAAMSPDRAKGAHKASLDDETRHFSDALGMLGRWQNRHLGLAYDRFHAFVEPLAADIGAWAAISDVGERPGGMLPVMPVNAGSRFVDLTDVKHIMTGDASSEDGTKAYEHTKKSQEKFWQKVSTKQALMLILAFGITFGMTVLALNYGGGGGSVPGIGGNVTRVPATLGVTL